MPKISANTKERARLFLERLKVRYPNIETHLVAHNPWELLVATVLAAQCTDARVNMVTPTLFARWKDPAALALAPLGELEEVIHSTGFYHNKAKNLLGAAERIVRLHDGVVPKTMAELTALPGLARKTANIVLWGGYGINEGLAVDTHVKRISYRMGFTKSDSPVQIEKELMPLFPQSEWGNVNHRMVWFGRHVCDARKPLCGECEMCDICPQNALEAGSNPAQKVAQNAAKKASLKAPRASATTKKGA